MKSFEHIDHVADTRLLVKGSTLEELFSAALEGMAHLINPAGCHPPLDQEITVELSSPDLTTLLIDFLSAVLTQTHLKKTVFCQVNFTLLSDTTLRATLHGRIVDHFEEDIKAVTYHEACVKKNEEGQYQTIIIFDI